MTHLQHKDMRGYEISDSDLLLHVSKEIAGISWWFTQIWTFKFWIYVVLIQCVLQSEFKGICTMPFGFQNTPVKMVWIRRLFRVFENLADFLNFSVKIDQYLTRKMKPSHGELFYGIRTPWIGPWFVVIASTIHFIIQLA